MASAEGVGIWLISISKRCPKNAPMQHTQQVATGNKPHVAAVAFSQKGNLISLTSSTTYALELLGSYTCKEGLFVN